ncbi:unnamed protein product [Arabidopsis thaliana]|uniref:Uncharacterized protein n=2 Tax=Arabidopsis thaliana TaxID=3702 RepID=A0A654FAC0_ARATH|nr:uncharacterized protein AT3G24516 [Arabidopsis thaliana]AEE76913.1 hypothetical protein AT3G24516 [Arabidopsis thaliana]VYS58483.1 unnamed protein product [Arabidopsis thaliana]|eukprot:NP_001118690.1 hypothetical protein AT3G24516 [Arabidopsis thaliana]
MGQKEPGPPAVNLISLQTNEGRDGGGCCTEMTRGKRPSPVKERSTFAGFGREVRQRRRTRGS